MLFLAHGNPPYGSREQTLEVNRSTASSATRTAPPVSQSGRLPENQEVPYCRDTKSNAPGQTSDLSYWLRLLNNLPTIQFLWYYCDIDGIIYQPVWSAIWYPKAKMMEVELQKEVQTRLFWRGRPTTERIDQVPNDLRSNLLLDASIGSGLVASTSTGKTPSPTTPKLEKPLSGLQIKEATLSLS